MLRACTANEPRTCVHSIKRDAWDPFYRYPISSSIAIAARKTHYSESTRRTTGKASFPLTAAKGKNRIGLVEKNSDRLSIQSQVELVQPAVDVRGESVPWACNKTTPAKAFLLRRQVISITLTRHGKSGKSLKQTKTPTRKNVGA